MDRFSHPEHYCAHCGAGPLFEDDPQWAKTMHEVLCALCGLGGYVLRRLAILAIYGYIAYLIIKDFV